VIELLQKLKRPLVMISALALVAALGSTAAMAAPGKGKRPGVRVIVHGGFGPFAGGPLDGFVVGGPGVRGGPGFRGGPGHFGFGFGHRGGPGGHHGGRPGILATDVLTPAASFLGISVAALAADLKTGKTLAQEAVAKGKTAAALIDAIVAAQKTVLDAQVAAGWITGAQATSMLGHLTKQITNLVNVGPPVPPTQKTGPFDAAATYLGMTVAEIHAALKSGKTLAEVATANGKTVDGLVAALTAQAKTKLDALVTAGKITAAQQQTLLTNLTKQVTDFVNNVKPAAKTVNTLKRIYKR
jgi:polyhydroxyalkanoate synthesis regulator phasin